MRKAMILFSFIASAAACNNSTQEAAAPAKTETTNSQEDPKAQKGLDLVAKSDCFTCHKIDEPSTGPSYTAVAAKYPNNQQVVDSLSGKIIKGGAGNWGTVPMIAHPQISPEDAKSMVEYVLSLKK
jgi:cytochrome c